MTIIYFLLVSYILLSVSLMKVFEKAGESGWKGLVPGLNFIVWSQIVGRPKWWAALLLLPIVNIFVYAGLCVDMVRSFGKYGFRHSALSVIYAPAIFLSIGYGKKESYQGAILPREAEYAAQIREATQKGQTKKRDKLLRDNPYRKTQVREWAEAIIFAVFAAAFIRMFLIEAYKIPTPSMEESLLVGDFLFVSKAHYGIRTPQTVLMVPLLHNIMPLFGGESYLSAPNLPMKRLPALESIDNNEPLVFNYPEGDSVYVTPGRVWSVHDVRRNPGLEPYVKGLPLRVRPIDKRDHYIKRTIGLPGQTVEIRDRQVFIDDQPAENPKGLCFRYLVKFDTPLNPAKLAEIGITNDDRRYDMNPSGSNYQMLVLTESQKAQLEAMDASIRIIPNDLYLVEMPGDFNLQTILGWGISDAHFRGKLPQGVVLTLTEQQIETIRTSDSSLVVRPFADPQRLFPHDPEHFDSWTVDNYGPITVPKRGETVDLKPQTIAIYRRLIKDYEGNSLEEKDGMYILNGEPATSYTFGQDYYWVMGDNRHNSEDSRYWGFVPHDHVVGKPLFIWFSTGDQGIRWNRIFSSAKKM